MYCNIPVPSANAELCTRSLVPDGWRPNGVLYRTHTAGSFYTLRQNLAASVRVYTALGIARVWLALVHSMSPAILRFGSDERELHAEFDQSFLTRLRHRTEDADYIAQKFGPDFVGLEQSLDDDGDAVTIERDLTFPQQVATCEIKLDAHPSHVEEGSLTIWVGARIGSNNDLTLAMTPNQSLPNCPDHWFGIQNPDQNGILIGCLKVNLTTGNPRDLFMFGLADNSTPAGLSGSIGGGMAALLRDALGGNVRVLEL